jgi:hypothetical protein
MMMFRRLLLVVLLGAAAPTAAQNTVSARQVSVGATRLDAKIGTMDALQSRDDPARITYGAQGDGSTDDYAALQAYFSSCPTQTNQQSSTGAALRLRAGIYIIKTANLKIYCSVEFDRGAVIRYAGPALSDGAVLTVGDENSRVANSDIINPEIDANDLVPDGIWLRRYAHNRIVEPVIVNTPRYGLHVGDTVLSTGGGFEMIASGVLIERRKGTIQPGSAGIFIDTNAGDNMVLGGIVKDAETGVLTKTGNNTFQSLHVWALGAFGTMQTCFDDWSSQNRWMYNQADTCGTYGFHIRSIGAVLIGNKFLMTVNSPAGAAIDGIPIGVHFDVTSPGVVAMGNTFSSDTNARWKIDFDVVAPSGSSFYGNLPNPASVVTQTFVTWNVSTPSGKGLSFGGNGDTLAFSNPGAVFIQGPNASHMVLGAASTGKVQVKGPLVISPFSAGNTTAVVAGGELVMDKVSPTVTAVGAGHMRLAVAAGTTTGTCKIVAYAGTSTTPVTIVDNVGTGC